MVMSGLAWPRCSCRARGVAGLPQALFDGPGVPEEVGVDAFPQSGLGGCGADDLPGPLAANGEEPVGRAQAPVEGEGLEAVDQCGRAGHQPGPSPLADNLQGPRLPAEMPHGEGQGLGDPETGLKEHQNEEGVPVFLPTPAAPAQLLDLLGRQVGDQAQGPGRQAGFHGQYQIRPRILLSRYPPEMAGRQRRKGP
jgi:hypothetical protein